MASCDKVVERGAEKQMRTSQSGAEMLDDGNLHVVLVGTGGPMPNTERVSVATAVIAGGEFILVDTGPGTIRNAMLQQLPVGKLSAVFLTHFHSDHIAHRERPTCTPGSRGTAKKGCRSMDRKEWNRWSKGMPPPMPWIVPIAPHITAKRWPPHPVLRPSPERFR